MKIRIVRIDNTEVIEIPDSEVTAFMQRVENDPTIVEVEMPVDDEPPDDVFRWN